MDKLSIYTLLFFLTFSIKSNGQELAFCNTHLLGNLDVRANNLIFLPRIKGGGERAYLFEIDDKRLGIVFWSWTSRPPYNSELTKAYIWNSRIWRRVKSDMIKYSPEKGSGGISFYGDFGKVKDICVIYNDERRCDSSHVDDFNYLAKKHGLRTTTIKGEDYRAYRMRNLFRFW
jgi:hypothetical protein